MKCPECNKIMIVLELSEVEIDYCAGCGGVWLDSGELEILMEKAGKDNSFLDDLSLAGNIAEKSIKCPLCRRRMEKAIFKSGEDLILDRCKKGEGFWMNKGELESVLDMAHLRKGDNVMELLANIFKLNTDNESKGG